MGAALCAPVAAAVWRACDYVYSSVTTRLGPRAADTDQPLRKALDFCYVATACRLWQRASPDVSSRLKYRYDWADEGVTSRNRLPMHTPLFGFTSTDQALAYWRAGGGDDGDRAAEAAQAPLAATRLMLSSPTEWRFTLVPSPDDVPPEFMQPGFDDSAWTRMPVPASWQLHGVDTPTYSNYIYPFACNPPVAERRGTWCVTLRKHMCS